MKKIVCSLAFCFFACFLEFLIVPASKSAAQGVVYTSPVAVTVPAPSGYCTTGQGYPIFVDAATGGIYGCSNGQIVGPLGGTSGCQFGNTIANGCTGATTAAGARANLGAAASGANSDITSLSGLTTPIPLNEGGTNATTAAQAAINIVNGNPIAPSSVNGVLNCASYSSLQACINAAPSGGQIRIPITATPYALGATGLTVASSQNNLDMECDPGATITYTGTGNALTWGDSSAVNNHGTLRNCILDASSASSGALAFDAQRSFWLTLDHNTFKGSPASPVVKLDGTSGNFSAYTLLLNNTINTGSGASIGVQMVNGANATTFVNGYIGGPGQTSAGSIGIDLVLGEIMGCSTDIEGFEVGLDIQGGSTAHAACRFEANGDGSYTSSNALSVSTIARSSGVVTATASGVSTLEVGSTVYVSGVSDSSYNGGPFTLTGKTAGASIDLWTLTWAQSGANSSSSGGLASGPCCDWMLASGAFGSVDMRGGSYTMDSFQDATGFATHNWQQSYSPNFSAIGRLTIGTPNNSSEIPEICFQYSGTASSLYPRSCSSILTSNGSGLNFNGNFAIQTGTFGSLGFSVQRAADSYADFSVYAGGQFNFGSGSAATDTHLYRSGVNAIKTDGTFNAVGQILGGSLQVASERKGTFTCTAGGTISISNTNYAATSDVVITMSTAGGTISTAPAMSTVTPGTGFTVLCGAADTSTYNYSILN